MRVLMRVIVVGSVFAASIGLIFVWLARPIPAKFEVVEADASMHFELVADGFVQPVYAVPSPEDPATLFVAEKQGALYSIGPAETRSMRLDLRSRVLDDGWERGFYSFAFDPDFEENHFLFVCYTAKGQGADEGRIVVERYEIGDDAEVSASTGREILSVGKLPDSDGGTDAAHNGGQIRFGPSDGYLYVSIGDGRRPRLTDLGAQDLSTLRGSILRIDVRASDAGTPYSVPSDNPFVGVDGVRSEIWAYGFRNPWRFSFMPESGPLIVSDVGQHIAEEVSIVRAGTNYGWPLREARVWSLKANIKAMGITKDTWNQPGYVSRSLVTYVRAATRPIAFPEVDYFHQDIDPDGGQSVVGGYVYLGEALPTLHGQYLFGDFINGRLWSLELREDQANLLRRLGDTDFVIGSITADGDGEPLITDYVGGRVVRMASAEHLLGTR